jgi:hypothetical protein
VSNEIVIQKAKMKSNVGNMDLRQNAKVGSGVMEE